MQYHPIIKSIMTRPPLALSSILARVLEPMYQNRDNSGSSPYFCPFNWLPAQLRRGLSARAREGAIDSLVSKQAASRCFDEPSYGVCLVLLVSVCYIRLPSRFAFWRMRRCYCRRRRKKSRQPAFRNTVSRHLEPCCPKCGKWVSRQRWIVNAHADSFQHSRFSMFLI